MITKGGGVVIEFEFGVKCNAKVNKTVDYFDEIVGGGGEGFAEAPSEGDLIPAYALELGGIGENHDFTFRCRKSHAIPETPELREDRDRRQKEGYR